MMIIIVIVLLLPITMTTIIIMIKINIIMKMITKETENANTFFQKYFSKGSFLLNKPK